MHVEAFITETAATQKLDHLNILLNFPQQGHVISKPHMARRVVDSIANTCKRPPTPIRGDVLFNKKHSYIMDCPETSAGQCHVCSLMGKTPSVLPWQIVNHKTDTQA